MRRKILTALLTTLAATACALGLAACKTDPTDQSPSGQTSSSDVSAPADSSAPQWGDVYTVETAYKKASELGYAGSLEEFIQMISGKDGQDGKDGADGKDGVDGKDGMDGKDGVDGKDGMDGMDGMDGRGIREVSVNQKGELVVAFTDGTSVTLDLDCPHRYSEWMIIAEPNCTSLGVKMRRCEICGDTEYDFSKATGHVWDNGFVLSEPTCTEDGQAVRVCEECGVMKLQTSEAKGHRYENCVCTVCGEIDVENMFVFTPTEKGTYAVALADDLKPTIKSVVIPSEYAGKPVTEIANSAFANCEKLAEVSLGSSVEIIGDSAFRDTALTHVVFPDSVREIRSEAFSWCTELKYITFSDDSPALKKIESFAFTDCAIEEVWLPEGDNIQIDAQAFEETVTVHRGYYEDLIFSRFTSKDGFPAYQVKARKKDITEAVIPAVYNGLPVARIASHGFSHCENLVSVTIPDSVTEIGNCAFMSCQSLKSITIPKSVTKIGGSLFRHCTALENISVEEGNPVYHSDGNCIIETATKTLVFGCKTSAIPDDGSVTKIGDDAFFFSSVESIVIPDTVTEIGDNAFTKCENLAEVSLGSSIKVIGRQAFAYTAVKYVNFPRSVREIGAGAFLSCTQLENLTFYDGVYGHLKTIGVSAFRSCALKEVWLPLDATDVAENAFDDGVTIHIMQEDLNFRSFTSEDGSVSYEVRVGVNNKDITEIIIPSFYNGLPVTRIASTGFGQCENLVSVTIPDSITEIGNLAFAMCHSLKSLTIPKSVTKIGRFIFLRRSCTALEALSVEEGNPVYHSDGNCIIETATKTLVYGCKNPAIPDDGSVTKIGEIAFFLSSVESIVIPDSVTEIGIRAFSGCQNLAEVTLSEGLKTIGENAFLGCTALKEIEIPASAEEIAENAFGSNTNVIFKEKEEAA